MIQGFHPRTGVPVGEPVPDNDPARRRAAVAAAEAALPAWSAFRSAGGGARGRGRRARRPRGRERGVADTETALGGERLTGEVARTTGQLRLFADLLQLAEGLGGVHPPGSAAGYLNAVVAPAHAGPGA